MDNFDSRVLYRLLSKGYVEIFSRFGVADGSPVPINGELSEQAKELYKKHGEFTDEGFILEEDKNVELEVLENGLGVIFEDGWEIAFDEKDLPATFLVEVTEAGILVDEFARNFRLDFEEAVERVFWLRNYIRSKE